MPNTPYFVILQSFNFNKHHLPPFCRAYEAGTTQNARSLGGNNTGFVRRRPAAATTESRRPSLTDR